MDFPVLIGEEVLCRALCGLGGWPVNGTLTIPRGQEFGFEFRVDGQVLGLDKEPVVLENNDFYMAYRLDYKFLRFVAGRTATGKDLSCS